MERNEVLKGSVSRLLGLYTQGAIRFRPPMHWQVHWGGHACSYRKGYKYGVTNYAQN